MAQALALELLAPTALVADGATAGTATEVDGEPSLQRVAQLTVSVTVYTQSAAGSSVRVYVDRRATASDAWIEGEAVTFTAVGQQVVGVEIGALTRVRYDLTNMTTGTLGVAGTAHTVYATPTDMGQALIARALAELSLSVKVQACITATDVADGYLGLGYVLPLTAWGADLTFNTARIAVANAITIRGADITGPDSLVYLERDAAVKWFNLVASGRIKPAGLTDTTPELHEHSAVVASRPSRWGCYGRY